MDDLELSDLDLKSISSYLNDPFSFGLWRLDGKLDKESKFCRSIWDEILLEINGKDVVDIKIGKNRRKIKVTDAWVENMRSMVFNSISFMFTVFTYLTIEDNHQGDDIELHGFSHDSIELLMGLIGVDRIKSSHKNAFEFFKDEIWFDGFDPMMYSHKIFNLKCGRIISLKGRDKASDIKLVSWSEQPLKKIQHFLELIERIYESHILPTFSPEEEVFQPYFDILEISYSYIVKQEHLKPLFDKSINQFKEDNFSDCVSAIGLMAEDLLTQVYETFFRTQLNKGLTLGQLTDEITSKVNSLFDKKSEVPPSFTDLYDVIKNSLELEGAKDVAALESIRSLLTLIISNDKFINKKIDSIGKPKQKNSVFPERVLYSINELIRFRNASSHKSRIPIGPYEATRSIYSLMIFIMWWENEKKNINWSLTADEIIRDTVAKNSNK